ncbi:MAG: hypothetical protein AAGD34_19085, partial [Pseudomonadota bacterium]
MTITHKAGAWLASAIIAAALALPAQAAGEQDVVQLLFQAMDIIHAVAQQLFARFRAWIPAQNCLHVQQDGGERRFEFMGHRVDQHLARVAQAARP